MTYGFDRFLTTHSGSLPRPDDLIRAMFAKEEGVPVDRTPLAARIRAAVVEHRFPPANQSPTTSATAIVTLT